MVHVSIVTQLG